MLQLVPRGSLILDKLALPENHSQGAAPCCMLSQPLFAICWLRGNCRCNLLTIHRASSRGWICRPRGRSSIIVPSGGADCPAWLAFRGVLARIEARTMNRPPIQVPPHPKHMSVSR